MALIRDFTNLADYKTASQVFTTDLYKHAPKLKFQFHTYFDINPEAYDQGLKTGNNFGLVVNTVQLPKYSFNTHQMNQYNRKRIIQTKIKYDPVSIVFHDDNGSMITKMWEAYYRYYYSDGNKPKVEIGNRGNTAAVQTGAGGALQTTTSADYNVRTTYTPSITGNVDWGYIGETSKPSNGQSKKISFFKKITIFGFAQQYKYTAYTLINPIITAFTHDTYNYDEGNGTMRNTMTLDYETVVYNYGTYSDRAPFDDITGFGLVENYDNSVSPIEGLRSQIPAPIFRR